MRDMTLDDLHGEVGVEHQLTYADGYSRRIYVVDREVPFPEGRLIVSSTDTVGMPTPLRKTASASGQSTDRPSP